MTNLTSRFKTPLWQKISLILLGICLTIILLEAGLRLGGFIILSLQEHANVLAARNKGTYRILCVGESTTQGQYPPYLEEILNQRNIGIKFSVIDEGRGGTTLSAILRQTESYLDKYHPNIVVTMMGINDEGRHMPFETPSSSRITLFLRSLRAYKLMRLLWLHLMTKVKGLNLHQTGQNTNQLSSLIGVGLNEALAEELNEDTLKKAVALNPKSEQAYIGLGSLYRIRDEFQETEDCFHKAISLNPQSADAYTEMGRLYRSQGRLREAEGCFKKALTLGSTDESLYCALASLYEEGGQKTLAQEYYRKASGLSLFQYNPTLTYTYQELKEVLDKRGIRLVCVQYPMRSIEPLKKISMIFQCKNGRIKVTTKIYYNLWSREIMIFRVAGVSIVG
jgi:lysophospholipase L1-like esterase